MFLCVSPGNCCDNAITRFLGLVLCPLGGLISSLHILQAHALHLPSSSTSRPPQSRSCTNNANANVQLAEGTRYTYTGASCGPTSLCSPRGSSRKPGGVDMSMYMTSICIWFEGIRLLLPEAVRPFDDASWPTCSRCGYWTRARQHFESRFMSVSVWLSVSSAIMSITQ